MQLFLLQTQLKLTLKPTTLLFAVLLVPFCSSAQLNQSNVSLDLFFSADRSQASSTQQYEYNDGFYPTQYQESALTGFHFGAKALFGISKRLSFVSGTQISKAGYNMCFQQYTYSASIEDQSAGNGSSSVPVDELGNPITPTGDPDNTGSVVEQQGIEPVDVCSKATYFYFEVPVGLRYQISSGKVGTYAEAALAPTLYLGGNSGYYGGRCGTGLCCEVLHPTSPFGGVASASVGVDYAVSGTTKLFAQPNLRYHLNRADRFGYDDRHLYSIGLQMGASFSF